MGGFSIHEFPSPSIEYFSKGGSESALNWLIQAVLEFSIVQPLKHSHKASSIEQIVLHIDSSIPVHNFRTIMKCEGVDAIQLQ